MTKALVGWSLLGFGAAQMPMLYGLHKYLVCKVPDSFAKGEFWRLLTCKLIFLDTKDLVLSAFLIYYFRLFERRLGSRRFFSRLASSFVLSTAVELAATSALVAWGGGGGRRADLSSGMLAVGPFFLVFPWFVSFYHDVPSTSGASFMGLAASSKMLTYFVGMNALMASNANLVAGVSGIVSELSSFRRLF